MDLVDIQILEDGTIRSETAGHVSAPNHQSAEAFVREVARLTGGETTRQKRGHAHTHQHAHEHTNGGGHSHDS